MIRNVLRTAYFVILASLIGCSSLAPLLSKPTVVSNSQTTSTPQPFLLGTPTPLPTTDSHVLRVWLPPRFDPNADTASAKLFKQRLSDFALAHPRIKLEVRIKAEVGDNSLLNSLAITGNAAPNALPDLIALSRPDLEAAALKGLLHPVDGLSTMLHDPNWYPYARELGQIQNIGYGLPFAGDALVLLHRGDVNINTWDEALSSKEPVLFPAGDPQALVVLSLYVSAGGKLVNEKGLPTLEEQPLTQTLTLIRNGLEAKTFFPSLLNFQTDSQALQSYRDGRAKVVITWASNIRGVDDGVMQPIPSLNLTLHTFTNGWVWALAGSAPENQQVATELAEYLITDDFVGAWTRNMNFLPTRLSQDSKANDMLESTQVIPSNTVLAVLGPILSQALSRILNGDQVEVVVRSVMDQVK